jgi:histidinol dehydrogenase
MSCNVRRTSAAEWQWYREQTSDTAVAANVIEILNRVKADGDRAVLEYTAKFDRVDLAGTGLRVPQEQLERAYRSLSDDLKAALANAADRIRHFHALQRRGDIRYTGSDGEELGLVWRPLRRVGVYAPGGRAAYPSTVLMNVIPAQVAGVDEIVLVSPPQPETGWPHELVLAAAHLLGVEEVYRMGGAQAVAALAYGTETVAKVDKIVGPGNAYVAYAKRLVAGDVGTDSIAGPSEVFIVADDSANPDYVAADLLAQAEHDPEAGAVCISTHAPLLDAVEAALEVQLEQLPRREIARQSLTRWGALVLADDLQQAVDVVNRIAPEHVELMVRDPEVWLDRLRTPGAVFLGHHTPESVGDYYAGTNHVLPTFGTGRFSSGLGVDDFLRRMSYVKYDAATLAAHAADICALADAEGLDAHKRAVEIRVAKGEARR